MIRGQRRLAAVRLRMSLAVVALLVVSGCQGEDRPRVDVIGGGGVVSVSGADEGPGGVPSGIRYTASSNQDPATQAALDLRDIRSVINVAIDGRPVDWPRALQLYEAGRNQKRPDGSTGSLAALADSVADAVFPGGASTYGRPAFIDGLIRDGLTGTGVAAGRSDDARRVLVDRGVQMLLYARALQALSEATTSLDTGAPGAPASIDRAWGYVAGPTDSDGARLHSLLWAGASVEGEFGLPGRLTRSLEAAFITMLAAAQKHDRVMFERYATEARGELAAIFYLGALRPSRALEVATRIEAREALLADGLGSFQAIRATVEAASPPAARVVQDTWSRPPEQSFAASDTAAVYGALNEPSVLQALGIPGGLQIKTPPARP